MQSINIGHKGGLFTSFYNILFTNHLNPFLQMYSSQKQIRPIPIPNKVISLVSDETRLISFFQILARWVRVADVVEA